MKRILLRPGTGLALAMACLATAVILVFAPSTWLTMMLRSFLPQWLAVFAIAALWSLLQRRWHNGLLTVAGGLLIAPTLGGPEAQPAAVDDHPLRIAHFNVLQTNERHDAVIAAMLRCDADVIGVQEVDRAWAHALIAGLSSAFPYHVIEPRSNCYGIALFSRTPLSGARIVRLGASPAITADLDVNGGRTRLYYVHTSSPGSPDHFAARNAQLRELEHHVAASPLPVVIAGDLNATPWDRDLMQFMARTGSRTHSSPGDPTFPSVAHMALIPIDHVLSPKGLQVRQRSVHVPGSDHRGLIADISFER